MRIQRTAILAASVIFCAMAAYGQEFEGRFRGVRAEVEATYANLQTLSTENIRDEFALLTPQMQGDVWTLHLLRVLDDHPELSHEQRSVFYEALGLIASGMFEAERRSPAWQTQFREQLAYIEVRARQLLPRALVRAALYNLNGEAAGSRNVTANGTCRCYSLAEENECGGSMWCGRTDELCTRTSSGCGPAFLDPCNGICVY